MFGMISPSSRTTVIDVTGGLSEVVKCLAARSTTASGCIGSDRDQSPAQLEAKQTAGLGLAPDHSSLMPVVAGSGAYIEDSVTSRIALLTLAVSLRHTPTVYLPCD